MGTDLQEPAVLEDTDPVTQTSRLFEIVGDEDQGPTSPTQELLELPLQLTASDGVQGSQGFVQEHQIRVEQERPGQANALSLPAGELPRIPASMLPLSLIHI